MSDRERLIQELLARRGLAQPPRASIPRRPAGTTTVPLSPMQRGMWFLDKLVPGNPAYVLSQAVRLSGPVDVAALRASAAELVARHEALRIRIRPDGVQEILAEGGDVFAVVPPTDLVRTESETPFDLGRAPLLRVRLAELGPDDHLLVVTLHHIVADERSLGIVLGELLDGHDRHRTGGPALPAPAVQFGDYVLWQQDRDTAGLEDFWQEQLTGFADALELPLDRPRPALPTLAGATRPFVLDDGLTAAIDALARRTGCTRFMIFLTAFQVVLARLAGQNDICVGSPVSLRDDDRLQDTVGLFVNSLPLRTDLSGDPALDEILDRVRRTCVAAIGHAALPFERIVELAAPARDPGRNPLFQVMLVLNSAGAGLDRGNLTARPVPLRRDTARLDLTVAVHEGGSGLSGVVDYRTDLFDEVTVDRLIDHLRLALHTLATSGGTRLSRLGLPAAELADLARWNDTGCPLSSGSSGDGGDSGDSGDSGDDDATLHSLVLARAAADPSAVAVLGDGPPLTYGDLDRRSALVAGGLQALGVRPGEPVGMVLPAGADAVVAILGILRAGAGYLPLDPAHPEARREALLRAAGVRVTVDAAFDPGLPARPGKDHPDQLAYVIHTSGSTGEPKGVMVAHRTAVNLARSFAALHGITAADRLLMVPPLSFDASVGDLFPALISGAALVVHPAPATLTGPQFLELCRAQGITLVDTAAPLFLAWVAGLADDAGAGPLRAVMVGGEPVPLTTIRRWAGRTPVYNHYGPTEATVCATTYTTVDGSELPGVGFLPIGSPLPGVRVHVLDAALRPVPIGRAGEVYIGGLAPALGYLGAPGATAARFVPEPYASRPGGRMYRTGDLARHRADGTLQFLGRTDRQVKIRGHRIELGEVEAACAALPGVHRAAVVAVDHPSGKRLAAYLVPADVDLREARAELRRRLPGHLVPAALAAVPELPTTRHGKLDLAALPEALGVQDRRPPRTATERTLAVIWQEMLGTGPVGANDNFFDLGGHSLLAARFAARAEQDLGVPVPLPLLFGTADLAGLAAAIDTGGGDVVPTPARLRADARLDLSFDVRTARDITDVLVTGATGFLGAALLADWLTNHPARVHCLVRAGDPAAATERVRANLDAYGLWQPGFADRLTGIPGDLAAPRLGLSTAAFAALGERVQAIVHNGGQVNFLQPYADLRPANVGGTREVLRLAAQGEPSAVHFVSTLGVFLTPARRGGLVREGDAPDDCDGITDGYNASKWVADALVRAARERGLPVSIHRPARVTGHSLSGAGNTTDYFSRLLTTFVQLGAVPDLDDPVDMAPVDYVAAGIGRLTRTGSAGDHHYYNNRTMGFAGIAEGLRSYGYRARLVPYGQWRSALLSRPDAALAAFAPLFGPDTPVRTQPAFDCSGTEAALAAAGIVCPAADEKLLHTYLAALAAAGVLDPPGSSHG